MDKVSKLNVFIGNRFVGTLASYAPYRIAFEYSDEWIATGFSLNPLSLPLEKRVFIASPDPFDGLFGVFNDSLPDGWGRLITDRLLLKNGVNPRELSALDRLAIIGDEGVGALSYRPQTILPDTKSNLSFDEIALECSKILKDNDSKNLDYLFKAGGSPGGARPKVFLKYDGDEWLIKFPSKEDSPSIGKEEYNYAMCAKKCGVEMSDVKLFKSKICPGYFGSKRFDRIKDGDVIKRLHLISASGLLETSHRIPNLDYNILMKLTLQLTRDMNECEKLYRLMCFNIFAHNRDDHSKNFSYIYLEDSCRWVLAPAYDLTYSESIGGEHATTVNGNGSNPDVEDAVLVAEKIGLNKTKARKITEEIKEIVKFF